MIKVIYKKENRPASLFDSWADVVKHRFCSEKCTLFYRAVIRNEGKYEDEYYIIEES